MISEELRQYINMVLKEEQDDVLHEMATLGKNDHGIQDIVIWVGKSNKQHGLRIKISNLKNRWSNDDDNFVSIAMHPFTTAWAHNTMRCA